MKGTGKIKSVLIGLAVLLVTAGSKTLPPLTVHRIQGIAQGTTYSLAYYDSRESVHQTQIDSIFHRLDQSLSIYVPQSLISQFNRSPQGIQMDEHLKQVVEKSLQITRTTDGVFDITVYPLVKAWGFGAKKVSTLPDSGQIRSLLACVGPDKISLHNQQLTKRQPCVEIDVNGIAQGYSVDVIANFLEDRGITNYIVEVGGEIRVKGKKYPEHTLMTIGIEKPNADELNPEAVQQLIQMEHGAVTTSGNYRKFRQVNGQRFSHIIDARTGFTSQNELISVTVVAPDAITADGYDNALLSMGLQPALSFLRQHPELQAYFIYQKPGGAIADTATTGFYQLMR